MTIVRRFYCTSAQINSAAGVAIAALAVKSWSMTFDCTWAPYVQGTVVAVAPTDAGVLAAMNPRAGIRFAGTLAMQDLLTGVTVTRPVDLVVRSRPIRWSTGEMTLSVASDESLAQDLAKSADYSSWFVTNPGSGPVVTDVIRSITQLFTGDLTTVDASFGGQVVPVDGMTWGAGTSAWDFAQSVVEAASGWYYVDELRAWRLVKPGFTADASTHTISGSDYVVDVLDTVSRDDPAWGTAAAVFYDATSPAGVVASDSGISPAKWLFVHRNSKKTGGNAATSVRTNAQKRGRTLQVDAIGDITARPNQTWRVLYRGQDFTGTLQSVTLNSGTGLMSMNINVIES
jgi:hypothetical protein